MRATLWAIVLIGCGSEVQLESKDSDEDPSETTDTTPVIETNTPTDADADTDADSDADTDVDTDADTDTTTVTDTGTVTIPIPPCVGGSSWRDTLPPLPPPVAVSGTLLAGSGSVLATCIGDNTIVSDVSATGFLSTSQAHNGGQWYFEAVTSIFDPGWSNVSIFARPSEEHNGSSYWGSYPWGSADYSIPGTGVVSVAADLDAGHVWYYEDGNLVDDEPVSLDPGVGAFRAHITSMVGNEIALNLGMEPFAYEPPPGFAAWSSDTVGSTGACVSDNDIPAPAAPITANNNPYGYPVTTFLSDATDPTELVVLGVYDAGYVQGVQTGSVEVTINRSTPVALVLSAYEPTDWTIVPGPSANIVSVSVYGMHNQTLSGLPAGTPSQIRMVCSGGGGGNCLGPTGDYFPVASHQWPYDTGGGATQDFVDLVEDELCLPLKMFGGVYYGTEFTVD